MISKTINYCWFGGKPHTILLKKCIASWKKFCPDYTIIEWNESNFDVSQNRFCCEAYHEKKYAYVADYARAKILYDDGGLYFDTDVELFKSFDSLLNAEMFLGIEHDDLVESFVIGCIKGHRLSKAILNSFEEERFINENDGGYNFHTMPRRITESVKEVYGMGTINNGLYEFDDLIIYPEEYFQPINYRTGKKKITKNTFSIHHYSASWYSGKKKFGKFISRIIGRRATAFFRRLFKKKTKENQE